MRRADVLPKAPRVLRVTPEELKLLSDLVAETERVIESEYGTGTPDPRHAERWPALTAAAAALNDTLQVVRADDARTRARKLLEDFGEDWKTDAALWSIVQRVGAGDDERRVLVSAVVALCARHREIVALEIKRMQHAPGPSFVVVGSPAPDPATGALLQKIATDAWQHWDQDRDHKVGKILIALAGHAPGYRQDVDDLRAALGLKP